MTVEEIYEAILRLPVSERRRLEQQLASTPQRSSHAEYVATLDSLFGALRDDPPERPPQGTFETRDKLP